MNPKLPSGEAVTVTAERTWIQLVATPHCLPSTHGAILPQCGTERSTWTMSQCAVSFMLHCHTSGYNSQGARERGVLMRAQYARFSIKIYAVAGTESRSERQDDYMARSKKLTLLKNVLYCLGTCLYSCFAPVMKTATRLCEGSRWGFCRCQSTNCHLDVFFVFFLNCRSVLIEKRTILLIF